MTKRLVKTFLFFLILVSTIVGMLVYSTYVSPEHLRISYTSIKSESIGEQLNEVEIGFFSDVHYNGFMSEERFTTMVSGMIDTHSDLILFGGDLFDPSKGLPTEEQQLSLIAQLKKLDAPLGKFAVLGSNDNSSEEMKAISRRVLLDSNFEVLDNRGIYIRKGGDQSIRIIGIDSIINGTPNIGQAFEGIKPDDYNIVLSHSPNLMSDPSFLAPSVNLFLSGNGFSSQVKLPVIGVIGDKVGHEKYDSGTYTINNTQLVISNGIGTLGTDMRFLMPPTYYVFRLQNSSAAPTN